MGRIAPLNYMGKVKVKTLQEVRLDGNNVSAGKIVDIDENILNEWINKGLATVNLEENKPSEGVKQTHKKDHKNK